MIESLKQESINAFPDYVNKWTKIGYDTTPLNKANVIAAVQNLYKCGGLVAPERIILAPGPTVGTLIVNMLLFKEANPNATEKEIKDSVKNNYALQDCVFGQHEVGWLSFYDFFKNETDLANLEKIDGLLDVARACGWVWAYDNVCVVAQKPLVCHVNDANQLHCTDGPAIAYEDGTMVFAYDGVIMEKDTIMHPEKITLEEINETGNEEQKRIKIEIYGTSKFLTDSKASIVDMDMIKINPYDTDSDSIPRALIKDKNNNFYLVGTDGSTHRTYYMNVPNTCKTCAEAHNAISPLDESLCIASS